MSDTKQLQVSFGDEDTFNDQSDVTVDHTIPVLDVTTSFVSGRSTDRSLQADLWSSRPGYRMVKSDGTVEFTMLAAGAQVDTKTGALVATGLHKLLADALGGGDLTAVGGVAGATATATAVPNATGTRPIGAIMRFGRAGDGKAEGQASVIGPTSTTLRIGLPGAPGETDEIRACLMAYLKQTMGASKRFFIRYSHNTRLVYCFTGCHCESITITYTSGEPVTLKFRYRYAYWRQITAGIAEGTLEQCDTAPAAGGSFVLQTVGTTTRPDPDDDQTLNALEMEVTLNLALTAYKGERPGLPLCNVLGYARTKSGDGPAGTLRLLYPLVEGSTDDTADAAVTEFNEDGSDTVHKHFTATFSAGEGTDATEGRHSALYIPDLYPIGDEPTVTDWNGQPAQQRMYAFTTGPDDTSDLSESAFRWGAS